MLNIQWCYLGRLEKEITKGIPSGLLTGKHNKFNKYAFNRFEFSNIQVNLIIGNIVGVFIKAVLCWQNLLHDQLK